MALMDRTVRQAKAADNPPPSLILTHYLCTRTLVLRSGLVAPISTSVQTCRIRAQDCHAPREPCDGQDGDFHTLNYFYKPESLR